MRKHLKLTNFECTELISFFCRLTQVLIECHFSKAKNAFRPMCQLSAVYGQDESFA